MFAGITTRDVAAERRSSAAFDGRHHLQLSETDMAGIGLTPSAAMVAEYISDLQRWPGHAGPDRLVGRCL